MKRIIPLILVLICLLSACNPAKTSVLPESHVCTTGHVQESGINDITDLYQRNEENNIITGFLHMYHPTIVKTDDKAYPYRMYFFGWAATETNLGNPGCDAMFVARGKNLDTWEVYSKSKDTGEFYWDVRAESGKFENTREWKSIIYASKKWYDNWHNGDPSVVFKDGKYYMAYSAYGMDMDNCLGYTTGDTDGDISCIMGATSIDGLNWTKTDYPILIWEEEIGKKEPVTNDGSGFADGEYHGMYHRPSIMYDEGKWKMWFDYISPTGMSAGYAENEGDFTKHSDWKVIRAGKNPLMKVMCNPEVIKIHDKYFMYGDPSIKAYGADGEGIFYKDSWTERQLVEFQSDDGINWELGGFIRPDSNTWANHVPTLYYEEGHLFLFYATQVGYGDKENANVGGSYNMRYNNLRYMTRCIDKQFKEGTNFELPYTIG